MSIKDNVFKIWKEKRPDIKSVAELERRINLGNGAIKRWDKSIPSTASLKKVSKFFKVSLADIMGESKKETKNKTADLLAAHIDDNATPEQIREIIDFIEFKKRCIDKEKKTNE